MDSYQQYRQKRNRTRGGSPVPYVVLAAAVLIAGVLAFSPLGTHIRDSFLVPLVQKIVPKPSQAPIAEAMAVATADPSAQPTQTPLVQETVLIKQQPYYILQMGSYDAKTDAQLVSNELQSMGGGGYIWEKDGKYRLFAAAYTDAESLKTVQSQIRKDGFVNEAYITNAGAAQVILEGDETAVKSFQNAAEVLESVPVRLSELAIRFDKGEIDRDGVREETESMQATIRKTAEDLKTIASTGTASMHTALNAYENALSTYLMGYDNIVSEFYAGALRHLQLEIIMIYSDFFEELNQNG